MEKNYLNNSIEPESRFIDMTLAECGKEQCLPQKYVGAQAKDYYTIHYILHGNGYIRYNGKEVRLSAGDSFIIYPQMLVEYYPDRNQPWTYVWLMFSGLQADKIVSSIDFDRERIFHSFGRDEELEELFEKMNCSYFRKGKITLEALGYAYVILNRLSELSANGANGAKQSRQDMHMREVLDFIYFNYQFNISVKDIAKSQNISPNYLCAIFNKNLGMSPKKYLTKVRMERAKKLLESKNFKVKDIAEMVGYKDQLHFAHEFKKTYGVAPSRV